MAQVKSHFMFVFILWATIAGISLVSCQKDKGEGTAVSPQITAVPLAASACPGGTLLNRLSGEITGINFQNQLSPANQYRYTYNGAGVAAGDYDGDGLADIYLVSEEGANRLFRNLGNLKFADATQEAGLLQEPGPGGFSVGAHFADFNNDGHLDLFVTNWNVTNQLFQNNGNGTFTDVTTQAGVTYAGGASTTAFADYDRDGDLDFFVATYRPRDFANEFGAPTLEEVNGVVTVPAELQDRLEIVETSEGLTLRQLGERDLLYRNNGDGTFTEVAEEAGITGGYWGLSASFADVDNDGWPDLYVTNDFWSPDGFYHNNGDGTFTPVTAVMVQHTPMSSMGVDFADINNDGLTDYFVSEMISRDHTKRMTQHGMMDMSPPPPDTAPQMMQNMLYLNNGDGSFSDISWLADVAASEWTWSAKFADLDLDGFVDLLITNGMIGDLMDSDISAQMHAAQEAGDTSFVPEFPPLMDRDLVFRNNGDLTFTAVAEEWGFGAAAVGHGMALADLDGDGDLEVVVNYLNEQVGVYCNNSPNTRLAVRLQGQASNRNGLGAKITLVTNAGTQTRQMASSGGYLSSHEPVVVFGLGAGSEIMELRIDWPSGLQQVVPGGMIHANQAYTISEPDGRPALPPAQSLTPQEPQFKDISMAAGLTQPHRESQFDDFAAQPTLPRQLSALGPGLAWGDGDGDGDDDLYVAGAAGQTGTLYRNEGNGAFTDVTAQTNSWSAQAEEMAPLWWTADPFVPPSLLLSYSSVELDGSSIGGQFNANLATPLGFADAGWSESAPDSSGALAAADFDGDGDVDVFVGGRARPGQWPLAASSRLYANDNGRLTDITAGAAPDLINLGLATGALWTDIDNDGDSDLVVATEWGPVRLFVNEDGRLQDQTAAANLTNWPGLWTGIVAADFNEDGHMDLAAANLGLNTKYTASAEHPAVLYGGDVDEDGNVDIVEAYYVGDTLYPLKERGMAGADMPFILEQFETFKAYGEATLDEIYGARLENAQRFEANTLEHTLFLNDGNGRFTAQPLPQAAQITSGYGIAAADFDNDGHEDIYLAGNFSYADHETMGYGGGISYWLRGDGSGSFTAVPAPESGLQVPYDARGVAVSDYNRDGWMDIAVAINNGHPLLFQNQGGNGNCALGVQLLGDPENPTGIGARITVTRLNGTTAIRDVQAGNGYLSQDSATYLFGLGAFQNADVVVRWPDGTETAVAEAPACETILIRK